MKNYLIDEGEYFPEKYSEPEDIRNETVISLSMSSGYNNTRRTRYESSIRKNM